MNIMYCRIGWAKSYDGTVTDAPQAGGSFNDNNIGYELYNFKPYAGKCYCYVKIHKGHSIRIDEHCGCAWNGVSVDGVLVVWVAKNPETGGQYIVGWYKNATVFRGYQNVPSAVMAEREQKMVSIYDVSADEKDATLLSLAERRYLISGMGQSNIWYGNSEINKKVEAYINGKR